MKAIVHDRYGPPDVLRVEDVETPEPGEGEALVRVRASSLNTADLDHLVGRPPAARLLTGLRRPRNRRLGVDVAGVVEAVGEQVTDHRPGDEVWADLFEHGHGAFAEYVCVEAGALRRKPADVTFEEAATVPHSGLLAFQGLGVNGGVRPGQRVLVNGAGGCVGPFAVQIAKAAGAEVTAVDSTEKLGMLRALGADDVVDYARVDVTRSGQTFDRVLDIAALRSVLRWRRSLAPGGTYVMIAPSLARFAEAALVGAVASSVGSRRIGAFQWRPNREQDLKHLASLIRSGKVRPLVDRRYSLDEVPEALAHLDSGRARGKLVVTM